MEEMKKETERWGKDEGEGGKEEGVGVEIKGRDWGRGRRR